MDGRWPDDAEPKVQKRLSQPGGGAPLARPEGSAGRGGWKEEGASSTTTRGGWKEEGTSTTTRGGWKEEGTSSPEEQEKDERRRAAQRVLLKQG